MLLKLVLGPGSVVVAVNPALLQVAFLTVLVASLVSVAFVFVINRNIVHSNRTRAAEDVGSAERPLIFR